LVCSHKAVARQARRSTPTTPGMCETLEMRPAQTQRRTHLTPSDVRCSSSRVSQAQAPRRRSVDVDRAPADERHHTASAILVWLTDCAPAWHNVPRDIVECRGEAHPLALRQPLAPRQDLPSPSSSIERRPRHIPERRSNHGIRDHRFLAIVKVRPCYGSALRQRAHRPIVMRVNFTSRPEARDEMS
jgi:hypothetical protein